MGLNVLKRTIVALWVVAIVLGCCTTNTFAETATKPVNNTEVVQQKGGNTCNGCCNCCCKDKNKSNAFSSKINTGRLLFAVVGTGLLVGTVMAMKKNHEEA